MSQEIETNEEVEFEEEVAEDQETEEETTEDSDDEQIDWKARAEKAEAAIVKAKEKAKKDKAEAKPAVSQSLEERIDRQDLVLGGIKDAKDQNEIMEYARSQNKSPLEVVDTPVAQAILSANKAAREVEQAKPSSNNRTGNGKVNELARAIERFKKDGTVPTDTKLAAQVLDKLAN